MEPMQEHFNLTNAQYKFLIDNGVSVKDLFYMARNDFNSENACVSKISLLYFIDIHGDFTEVKNNKDLVANTIFESLDIKDKIEIGEYLNWYFDE